MSDATLSIAERDVILQITPPTEIIEADLATVQLATDRYLSPGTLLRAWAPRFNIDGSLNWGGVDALAINYNENGGVESATVRWPDKSFGSFVATAHTSDSVLVNAFRVTHTDTDRTVYQRTVTRDPESGRIDSKPALVVTGTGPIALTVADLPNVIDTVLELCDAYPTVVDLMEAAA